MALRAMRIRKVETRHTYVRRIHCLEARPFGGLLPDLTTYGFVGPILLNISSPLGEGDINTVPQHILDNPKECAGTPRNKISISIYGSFLKLFAKKSLLRAVTAGLLCPAGPRTQESSHIGWSVPTEWFPVHPPFCFNPSDWGGALSSFLPSSLLSLITISF